MKAFVLIAALCGVSRAVTHPPNKFVPGKYIVQLSTVEDVQTVSNGGSTNADPHKRFHEHLRKRQVAYSVPHEYTTPGVFVGASVTLENDGDLPTILEAPGVISVRPVLLMAPPTPVNNTVKVVENPSSKTLVNVFGPHVQTNITKLHAMNILGEGVTVAILDTRLDYKHPAFGGGFGEGFKAALGYDFVGDAYDGTNTPVPDADPFSECSGHGTHVAGIVAADDTNYGFTGVAPSAKLAIYRVFGCEGSSADDVIIDALLKAYNDGADIISLSLGGSAGWTESASSLVASNIADAGRILTIAAGNDGDAGMYYASGPAGGENVISVGSAQASELVSLEAITSTDRTIQYYAAITFDVSSLPIYVVSPNNTAVADDACAPLPDSTPDLSGYVTVIRRGTCPFNDKAKNVAAKGGKFVLFYNNGGATVMLDTASSGARGSLISAEDGLYLVEQYNAGTKLTISFPASDPSFSPAADAGRISSYSTYGPNFDLNSPQPVITGVGGNVLSTWPVALGSYADISGTSMATPQVAGIAALYLSAKGKGISALDLRARMATTAVPVLDYVGSGLYESVIHQGGGLVNAYCTVFANTTLSSSSLSLNDTRYFKGTQKFTISNSGPSDVTYTLSNVPAGTALAYPAGSNFQNAWPVPLVDSPATVTFSSDKVTVAAGATAEVTATFVAPTGLDATQFPVYSGYLQLSTDLECESHLLPYYGIAGAMYDQQVIDNSAQALGYQLPGTYRATTGDFFTAPETFMMSGTDLPVIEFRLSTGSPFFSVDVVSADATITPTYPVTPSRMLVRRRAGRASSSVELPVESALTKRAAFQGAEILGSVTALEYAYRNSLADDYSYRWDGTATAEDGTTITIPNGSYKLLLRALKITGSRQTEGDFETWLSPTITIARG